MAYSVIDIDKLVDPSIECGDRLAVNMQKWKSLILLLSLLCLSLFSSYRVMPGSRWEGIFVMVLTVPLLGWACYCVAVMYNPILAIDKSGISIRGKFYSWNNVDRIFFERNGNRKKASRIRVHLKNGGLVTFFIPIFVDQKPPEIAAYVVRYFKPVQAKV